MGACHDRLVNDILVGDKRSRKERDISNSYEVYTNNILGEGSSASIILGVNKKTREYNAIKVIHKDAVASSVMRREVMISKLLQGGQHVLKVVDAFESSDKLYIVSEYCAGGDLLSHIALRKRYSEADASKLMYQLFLGLKHIHDNDLCHRDIQPVNILFRDLVGEDIVISDFGSCLRCKDGDFLNDPPTSSSCPVFAAPEVYALHYNKSSDIWSAGVTMFTMVYGKQIARNKDELMDLYEGKLPHAPFRTSAEFNDLLSRLLHPDWKERLTLTEALNHPWISQSTELQLESLDLAMGVSNAKILNDFKGVEHQAVAILASYLTSVQIENLNSYLEEKAKSSPNRNAAARERFEEKMQCWRTSLMYTGINATLQIVTIGKLMEALHNLNFGIAWTKLGDLLSSRNIQQSYFGDFGIEWQEFLYLVNAISLSPRDHSLISTRGTSVLRPKEMAKIKFRSSRYCQSEKSYFQSYALHEGGKKKFTSRITQSMAIRSPSDLSYENDGRKRFLKRVRKKCRSSTII